MKPSHKYWIFILGISGIIFGVIAASVIGSWYSLDTGEQRIIAGLAEKLLPFPLMGAIILMVIIGGLVSLLFRYYIIPVLKMAEATQLITLANPGFRIAPEGAREVAHLAETINASAEAYEKLHTEVETTVSTTQAELKEERNRFAALMSELPLGVLACNADGQILLYNQQAQLLLHLPFLSTMGGAPTGGWLGLGRSIFGLLSRETIEHRRSLLQEAVERGDAAPTTSFQSMVEGGRTLRVTMAPVFSFRCHQHGICLQCERRQMTGLVFTFEDISMVHDSVGSHQVSLPPDVPDLTPRKQLPSPRPVYYEFDLFNQRDLRELGKQPLRKLTFVVFDTETTGLNPSQGDEIIQIGAVRIVNCRILEDEVIDQLIDPRRSIPEESVSIHGISDDMVAGQPTIEHVLPHFHRFVEGAVLVAHNAAFDMRCLQLKEERTGVRFSNPVLDTLLLSTVIHPHQGTHSIESIAQRLNLSIFGRHTALGDALVTAEVLLKLIPLLEARGIVTLEDALRISGTSPYAKLNY